MHPFGIPRQLAFLKISPTQKILALSASLANSHPPHFGTSLQVFPLSLGQKLRLQFVDKVVVALMDTFADLFALVALKSLC